MIEDIVKLFYSLPFNLFGSDHENELEKLQDFDYFRNQESNLDSVRDSYILNIF